MRRNGASMRDDPQRRFPGGEFAKRVGNGTGNSQRGRGISGRCPSEAVADRVEGAVGHPTGAMPLLAPGVAQLCFWCAGQI